MSETIEKARTLLEEEKYEEALEILKPVSPATPEVKGLVARCLGGLSRFEEAHALFSELLEEDPNNHEGYAGRGLLYFFTGHPGPCHADYSKAIECAPDNGRYWGLRGVFYMEVGDGPRALADFEKAYEVGCHDPSFILARIQVLLKMREMDQAREMMDLAEEHGADEAALAALEGGMCMMSGEPKEALASYRFATEKAPESPENWLNMLALTAQFDRGRLLPDSLKALEAHPDDPRVIQVAVGANRESGKIEEAFKILKDAIGRQPKSPLLHFQMGMGLASISKFAKAVEAFTAALECAPRFPRALDARGNCYEQMGEGEKAKADLEAALAIRQEDMERAKQAQAQAMKSAEAAQAAKASSAGVSE